MTQNPRPLPTGAEARAAARRMRNRRFDRGGVMTDNAAMEAVAASYGFDDAARFFGALVAQAIPVWSPGTEVFGTYAETSVKGTVTSVAVHASGVWNLTVSLSRSPAADDLPDRVTCLVNGMGQPVGTSPLKLSL